MSNFCHYKLFIYIFIYLIQNGFCSEDPVHTWSSYIVLFTLGSAAQAKLVVVKIPLVGPKVGDSYTRIESGLI